MMNSQTSRAWGCWHEGQHPASCFPFHSLPGYSPAAGIMHCPLHCSGLWHSPVRMLGWATSWQRPQQWQWDTSNIPVSHLHPWW